MYPRDLRLYRHRMCKRVEALAEISLAFVFFLLRFRRKFHTVFFPITLPGTLPLYESFLTQLEAKGP